MKPPVRFNEGFRNHLLVRTFFDVNHIDLVNPNPNGELLRRVFGWIDKEANCIKGDVSKRANDIQVLTEVRLWAERYFASYPALSLEAQKESGKVGKHLRKVGDRSWRSWRKFYFGSKGFGIERDPPDF